MKSLLTISAPILTCFFVAVCAPSMSAQVTNAIKAHIDHSFVAGEKTLPPGDYTFRMSQNSNLSVMVVENQRGDNVAQFTVQETTANHTPRHSELVFRKYGNTEFLRKIFEGGSKSGSEIYETSKEEARMVSDGQHAMEHTEEQH